MQLVEVVEASRQVASTRSRKAKIATLVDVLRRVAPAELPVAVSYLAGEPRQDRLDVGPAAVYGRDVPAASTAALTLVEVDEALQAIADVEPGTGSRTRRIALLDGLLARATAEEQAFLRALVLRELRQGALAGLLTQAVAAAAEVDEAAVRRAHMLSGDLRATAIAALSGGHDALSQFRLEVGVPLEPMLAATSPDLTDAMGGGPVALEAKLDGARVQVHRDGDRVRVFTRNLNEVTHRVPEVVAAAMDLPVQSVVLDGEAIALDADGRPRPFQETMSRFGRQGATATAAGTPMVVRFFDVLHLDGDDVLDQPLHDRLGALDRVVPEELRLDRLVTADAEEAAAFVKRVLAAGHEGVMAKDLEAPYEAGRRGSSWRKLKPVHTLDLVVLAAEWGSGRRRGWLSNLHLGARDGDGGFVMLGKTFKGLTDETLTWQTEQLLDREVSREGHVVYVRPELVVEIAFDGVQGSSRYPGGVALRFARVKGYRPDKDADDADHIDTVHAIHRGERLPLL